MKHKKRFLTATSLVFTCALCFTACNPLAFLSSDSTSSTTEPPPTPESFDTSLGKKGLINSLGKWNYYAAKKTIADYGATPTALPFSTTPALIIPTTNMGYDESTQDIWVDSEEPETITSEMDTPSQPQGPSRPQDTEDVRYYDLYSWGELTIERTVYFQMELTDETAFLGRILGTGTVEVAVALGDYLADLSMITFRNGDNFYSCMYHGYEGFNEKTGAEVYSFAAYRYIEGFYYVKNLKYEHYKFYLEIREDSVDFYCDYRHSGEENEQVRVIEGTSYCIDQKVTYTIEELEAYFNGENANEAPESTLA